MRFGDRSSMGMWLPSLAPVLALCFALSAPLHAALPVVLLNGYNGPTCPVSASKPPSADTFGNLEALLNQGGISAVFFDNCQQCPGCTLEDLGKRLATFLGALKFSDGTPVPRVDVVAVSMGGLIVRAYLSGIQTSGFNPPVDTKIRKAVFIGTPHFGTSLLASFAGLFPQTSEMTVGSSFLANLATWNMGWDDLRGVDAVAIIGSGGTNQYDDGVVGLSSASLSFTLADYRTRVIPYCHTDPANFLGIFACQPGAKTLDVVDNSSHLVYRIVSSFLNDTAAWRSIGNPPSQDPYLASNGGAYVSLRTANDQAVALNSVTAAGQTDAKASYQMGSQFPQTFFSEWMVAQDYQLTFGAADGTSTQSTATVSSGGIQPQLFKFGPQISSASGAGQVASYSVAPGQVLYIYGSNLASSEQQAPAGTLSQKLADAQIFASGKAMGMEYVSDGEIDAVLPTGILGLITLRVQNSIGQHTINLMVEPAVPSVYSADGSGAGLIDAYDASGNSITQSNPTSAGQPVTFYATGLGETTKSGADDVARAQIAVTVGGVAAQVGFAGRARGDFGVDEIDITMPKGVTPGQAVVYVFANNRVSNPVTLPVR